MEEKFHGSPTSAPLGFDHVSFTVDSREELFGFKDKLEAAGVEVTGAIDHGTLWSIYFFDPNNIPLEITWDCLEVTQPPAIEDDDPVAIAAEGAAAFITPGKWFSRVLMNAPAEGTLAWFYNRVLPVFEPSFLRAADGAYAGVRRWRPFEPAVAHAATKRPSA